MKYIGKEYARVDGLEKIKGSTKYVDDFKISNMLYVSVVRSSIPYGNIVSIDTREAMLQGVVGIYKAEDFSGVLGLQPMRRLPYHRSAPKLLLRSGRLQWD